MSFARRTTAELVRIASSGGGFTLDAAARPTADLVRIAAAGRNNGARLVFAGLTGRPTEELVRIGAAGAGCVRFEA